MSFARARCRHDGHHASVLSKPTRFPRLLLAQVYEYLEVHQRVQLLNDRFSVMQELLDILRVHAQVRGGGPTGVAGQAGHVAVCMPGHDLSG